MERKHTLMLCCLALLFLGGTAFAGNTPWPKWDTLGGAWNYRTHYYFGCPNVQGPNGQGQGYFVQYQGIDFKLNGLGTMIAGMNIHVHDFNGGANTLKMKAFEMRYENPNITGCPDWSANGKITEITPVPYISNWASLRQYPFSGGPVSYPVGLNTLAVCQYDPSLNHCAGGIPMCAHDNGIGGQLQGSSGRTYGFGGTTCFGPSGTDVWMAFYGNPPPQPAEVHVRVANVWYDTDSYTHSMTQGQGVKFNIQLVNNFSTMAAWGPGTIELWMHEGNQAWNWYIPPGVDLLSALSGGGKTNPISVRIPPTGIASGAKLTNMFGLQGDYLFNAFTMTSRLYRPAMPGSVDQTDIDEWLMCPKGAEDDSESNAYYWSGTSANWGRGHCHMFNKNHFPNSAFTITRVQAGITSWYNGGGVPLYRADVRTEATYGFGQYDLTPAGLLGTFDRRIGGGGMSNLPAYDTTGNPGIPFLSVPTGNIYAMAIFNASNLQSEGWYQDHAGKNYIGFGTSFWNAGNGARPYGQAMNSAGGGHNYMYRLVMTQPLDGAEVDLKALSLERYGPVATKAKN